MTETIKSTRRVKIELLVAYGKNPRRGDVEAIKESLQAHGQFRALVVREGTNEVLAGNHTLKAMLELGAKSALVHYIDVDDEQAARIVLVDNRSSDLASQDLDVLTGLLQSLPDLEGTAYAVADLEALTASFPQLDADSQPRLDQRGPVTCPECGHDFVPPS